MLELIHISDLHIHKDEKKNQDVYKRIEKLGNDYPTARFVITGDISDDGDPYQMVNSKNILDRNFQDRYFVVPGNHDYGTLGFLYSEKSAIKFDEIFGKEFQYRFMVPYINNLINPEFNIVMIGLNSNLRTENPFDFACGLIGQSQLNKLDDNLRDFEEAEKNLEKKIYKIVYLHHHPFIHTDPTLILLDAKRLIRICYGRVDLLLFGHDHKKELYEYKKGFKFISAAGSLAGEFAINYFSFKKDEKGEDVLEGRIINYYE